MQEPTDLRPGPIMNPNNPGNCFASSIAPLKGFSVKGAIFHQGYNNCFNGSEGAKMYYQVFGVMIKAWRENFGDPKMPFGIISLCTAGEPQDKNNFLRSMLDAGAEIREAQYKTFLDLKKAGDTNIGFASSFDQRRSWYHPQLKIPVGERIAKWALTTQYDIRLNWEPPYYTEMKVEDGKIILSMNVWTTHGDTPIAGFAIAGKDGRFQPANAEFKAISKDKHNRIKRDRKIIVLSSPLVPEPVHFRYAYGRSPLANVRSNMVVPLGTQRRQFAKFLQMKEQM